MMVRSTADDQKELGQVPLDDIAAVIANAHANLVAHEQNDESLQVEWVKFDDVEKKVLHPSFAKSWPALLARLEIIFI